MSQKKSKSAEGGRGVHVQFNLIGLVVFSASLIFATASVLYALGFAPGRGEPADLALKDYDSIRDAQPDASAPWGEMLINTLEIERPEEYIAPRANSRNIAPWVFEGMKPDQVRQLMNRCGLTPSQINQSFDIQNVSVTSSGTTVKPPVEVVLALSPETRVALYDELKRFPANEYIRFPFFLTEKAFDEALGDCDFDPQTASMVRSLTYRRGDYVCLSDLEAALQGIPSEDVRLRLVKAVSRQTIVLPRLRIRPTTDIDKLLGYWGSAPGVRVTNLRPLLESLQRSPDGGTLSLIYLLPPFARERLYTYPLSSHKESWMDCGWSALNFFNDTEDNRFADPDYFRKFIANNYYRVEKPTRYGDLLFVMDENGRAVHSAVYIADDLVFTKNGANYMQPWVLMRIKDVMTFFSGANARSVAIFRNNKT